MSSEATKGSEWSPVLEGCTGLAALIRTSPWCFTPNQALQQLMAETDLPQQAFERMFEGPVGQLPALLSEGRAFSGRLRVPAEQARRQGRLLHADLMPLSDAGMWIGTFLDLSPVEDEHTRCARTLYHLEDTLHRMSDYLSLVARDETLLFMNRSMAQFYGATPERIEGRTVLDFMGPANHALTLPYRRALFDTGEPIGYERILINSEGSERVLAVALRSIQNVQGETVRMATFSRDITLRHQGMEAIRRTLERLDALFGAGIEGIVLCEDGRVRDANPVAARHLGTTVEELVGQPLDAVRPLLGLPSVDAGPDRHEPDLHWCRLPAPSYQAPLQIQSIRFLDAGRPCHAILLQDMSYRLQAQRRIDRLVADLRQQTARAGAADRSKSVFLASASHDLRQPIHSLGLFLTTIQKLIRSPAPLDGAALQPIAQRMRVSLDNLTQLLDALLGASLQHAERAAVALQPVALQSFFDTLVADFAPQALGKGLHLRAIPSRAWVLTDPIVLRRILANLVANAVRYTARGRIVIGARLRGARVEVQVWDSGVGIPSEQIGAIFEAFYRVDLHARRGERAEGLGLSIVKQAATELGAQLDVRSTLHRGSMFSVTQPRCMAQGPDRCDTTALPACATDTRRCVLLIDDDEQVLDATASLLTAWGHDVIAASSAGEALRLCACDPRRIDAVICDYMTDSVINELEQLLDLPAVHNRRMAVCMVTGDMSVQRQEQAHQHGFELLHKPVAAPDLQRFLQRAG